MTPRTGNVQFFGKGADGTCLGTIKLVSLSEDFGKLRYQLLPLVINKSMLFVR